jgi:hypothetical protein
MTEQQYADIAAACDRLLRAPGTSLARLAIPALHVINEHPGSLAQYASLLSGDAGHTLIAGPRALLRAARGFARSVLTTTAAPALAQTDVIIVSHLSNAAQLSQADDFYFGPLQSLLQERGLSSLLVLLNHLPRPAPRLATRSPGLPRLVLPRAVPTVTELDIWRQCRSAGRYLRREAHSARNSFDRRVATFASRQALSAGTAVNLRMHSSLSNLCRALDPKIVITTHEGDAAERLIWHAARSAARRPLCVGYQHARLLQRAHAIRRPVQAAGLECDPDVVLTLGPVPHAVLAASPGLGSVRLIEYGSHRRIPPADLPHGQHRPRQCLVLPDADDRECAALFEFALLCARQRPDVKFALRPHPIVDTRSLIKRHPALRTLPGNVRLSADEPLIQAFAQARYCLYRGSSAAMHAVLAGLKPFYLARPGELAFDPLFELNDWRETVTSPDELSTRMKVADETHDPAAATRASGLYERYVAAVRPRALDELLEMVRS